MPRSKPLPGRGSVRCDQGSRHSCHAAGHHPRGPGIRVTQQANIRDRNAIRPMTALLVSTPGRTSHSRPGLGQATLALHDLTETETGTPRIIALAVSTEPGDVGPSTSCAPHFQGLRSRNSLSMHRSTHQPIIGDRNATRPITALPVSTPTQSFAASTRPGNPRAVLVMCNPGSVYSGHAASR